MRDYMWCKIRAFSVGIFDLFGLSLGFFVCFFLQVWLYVSCILNIFAN